MFTVLLALSLPAPDCHVRNLFHAPAQRAGCAGTYAASSCYGSAGGARQHQAAAGCFGSVAFRTPVRTFAANVRKRHAVETTVYYPETLGPADPCMPDAPRAPLPNLAPPKQQPAAAATGPVYEQRCVGGRCYLIRVR